MKPENWERILRELGAVSLEPLPDGSCPLCGMLGMEDPSGDKDFSRLD